MLSRYPPPTSIMHELEYFFQRNAHLFRLHIQLKGNKWRSVIINFNLTVLIN